MLDLTKYTKVSKVNQKEICRWLCRQNDEILYEMMKSQKRIFYKIKAQNPDEELLVLATVAFILASKEIKEKLSTNSLKNKTQDLGSIQNNLKLGLKQLLKPKPRPKFEKMLNYKNVILDAIDKEGASYEEVRRYLEKKYSLKISRQYVGKFYNNIKKGEEND